MYVPLSFEARGFLLMCLAGMTFGAVCNMIKIMTASVKEERLGNVLAGVGISLCYAFVVSFASYYYNHSQLRYFMPIAFLTGSILYFFTVGRAVGVIFEKMWKIFLKICSFIFKILLTPLRFLLKIILMPIGMAGKMLSKLKARLSVFVGRIVNEKRKKEKILKKHSRDRNIVCVDSNSNDNSGNKHSARHKSEQAGDS